MTPHYRQSFIAALTGHLLLIVTAIVVSVLPGCRRPKPVDLSAFENIDITKIDAFNKLERIKPPSKNVTPPPVPPPPAPTDLKMPDDPVPVKPRPPPPTPVKQPDRTEGTQATKTPVPVKPATSASNRTSTAAVPVTISKIRTTKVLPTSGGPRRPPSVKLLTPGELDPLNGMDAPIGKSNSVPMDERQQCLLRIKQALYAVWDRPTLADAGQRPALLQIRFDAGGRVVGAQIAQSSGSDGMDRSVLLAAKTVMRVDGLTAGFLKQFQSLTVEFTVTE